MSILSFSDRETELFFESGRAPKRAPWKKVEKVALRKLDMLDYANQLSDLKAPPGNRLEALKGDWKGYYSIRINNQWRIVFRWTAQGPAKLKIIDYHRG